MNIAELMAAIGDRPIARTAGVCLFTVYTASEADEWKARGATVVRGDSCGRTIWEVRPAYCLPAIAETNDDGEAIDTRPAFLLAYLRERDGYARPWKPGWLDG